MKNFMYFTIAILLLIVSADIVYLEVVDHYKPRKIERTKIDGCRWFKINKEPWQHSTSCDNKCHL